MTIRVGITGAAGRMGKTLIEAVELVGEGMTLAAAIERMLDDQVLRNKCVSAATAKSRGYDYRRMVYKTLGAYRGVLGHTPAENPPAKGSADR